jgi:transcriptional regulator with XRE-family HTH domain
MESHHGSLKTLGRALRYRRWNRKISMNKLAEKSGVSYRSIIAYEHGVAQPSMRNLLKLCEVLDLHITLTPNEDIDRLEY